MGAALGVHRLQQVDRQIDRAQAGLEAIRKSLEDDAAVAAALAQVEEEQRQHHHARHDLELAEVAAKTQEGKIREAEASLYGGQGRNPKELQELQLDVEALSRYLATLEERELEAMSTAETAEGQLRAAEERLRRLKVSLGHEHQKLLADQAGLAKELERLGDEREAAVNAIDAGLLDQYERLRDRKRGLAVAEVRDDACSACGTTLTAMLQQNARSAAQVAHCPSCGRILYVP